MDGASYSYANKSAIVHRRENVLLLGNGLDCYICMWIEIAGGGSQMRGADTFLRGGESIGLSPEDPENWRAPLPASARNRRLIVVFQTVLVLKPTYL